VLDRARKPVVPVHQALVLGLLQGPTELLPISSSAHTTLIPWLAGWRYAQLDGELRKSFEVALHAGASVALTVHMRRELFDDITHLHRRHLAVIALSVAPTAIVGYALAGPIERRLGGPRTIAASLVAGAVAMASADVLAQRREHRAPARARQDATAGDGLALGLAQAVALIPGVSRNGATLTAARARGFGRGAAQALSWHAGLPVMFGAGALRGARLRGAGAGRGERAALAAGGVTAFASTLASAAVLARSGGGGRSALGCSLYRCLLAALVISRLRRAQ
jgi:undecaprenyl-diphosphatase